MNSGKWRRNNNIGNLQTRASSLHSVRNSGDSPQLCFVAMDAVEFKSTSQVRQAIGFARPTTQDVYMRECKAIEELSTLAHDHLDVLSPCEKSAFLNILSKLRQNRGGGPPRTDLQHVQIKEQIGTILRNHFKIWKHLDLKTLQQLPSAWQNL